MFLFLSVWLFVIHESRRGKWQIGKNSSVCSAVVCTIVAPNDERQVQSILNKNTKIWEKENEDRREHKW